MTEAFEKWVAKETTGKGDYEWERVHPLSRTAAHFWLSAFVKEVERRYTSMVGQSLIPSQSFSQVYQDVVRDFGLDGK